MSRARLVSRKFGSAIERVRWAEQDILQIKETALLFFASPNIYERVSELDADGLYYVDKIKFKARFPRADC